MNMLLRGKASQFCMFRCLFSFECNGTFFLALHVFVGHLCILEGYKTRMHEHLSPFKVLKGGVSLVFVRYFTISIHRHGLLVAETVTITDVYTKAVCGYNISQLLHL